jgi:hypothetical protein
MIKIKREEDNPSCRFFCLSKETLDNLLDHIEKARKSPPNIYVLGTALDIYIQHRRKVGCEGCDKGAHSCPHWSPEKVEVG